MPKDAKKKVNDKNERHFLKDVKAELKKVIWPTPKQLLNNTLAVLAIVIVVGVIVFALDVCFEKINSLGVEILKTVVENLETKDDSATDNETSNEEANDTSAENDENVAETETNQETETETTSEAE